MYDDGTAFFLYQCIFVCWMSQTRSRSLYLVVVLSLLLCCGIVLEVLLRYLFVRALMGAKFISPPLFFLNDRFKS